MKARFFASPADWRRWLAANHDRVDELWVGFYKKASGKPSITWVESVDEALCFGWIDGIRKTIDADRYMNRFTPRRRGSTWSAVNIKRVAALKRAGRMHEAGLRAFRNRKDDKTAIYSYEQRKTSTLPRAYARTFKANKAAWTFFSSQAPSYQRVTTGYVISAKQEETRQRRLAVLIEASARGRRLGP